jgi:hypothetical protein
MFTVNGRTVENWVVGGVNPRYRYRRVCWKWPSEATFQNDESLQSISFRRS